jgi:CspA family cold shock protein
MGRCKDYREPKRRGYDNDERSSAGVAGGQADYPSARPSPPQASEPIEATVKWFNADKGFGFVALARWIGCIHAHKAAGGGGT